MAGADLALAVLLLAAIWGALPARWWPVDVLGTTLALLLASSGAGLLTGARWAKRVAVGVGALSLVAGLGLFTALALTAAQLTGMYGPVGGGGAIILTVVALLLLPYLVVFPAAKLLVLRPRTR